MTELPYHTETRAAVRASADVVFEHLDDPVRLAAHMTKRSWVMAGSRMFIDTDAAKGRAVGSLIRLHGRVLGVGLELQEEVTERVVPLRKTWVTRGEPRLLVIGAYRMGFEIEPVGEGCLVRVHLDYARPRGRFSRVLAGLLGGTYGRWCTQRMAREARGLERGSH